MPSLPTTADSASLTQLLALCIAIVIVKIVHSVWNRLEDHLEPAAQAPSVPSTVIHETPVPSAV